MTLFEKSNLALLFTFCIGKCYFSPIGSFPKEISLDYTCSYHYTKCSCHACQLCNGHELNCSLCKVQLLRKVAAACNVRGWPIKKSEKGPAEYVYKFSEMSNYGWKLADGQLLFLTLIYSKSHGQ